MSNQQDFFTPVRTGPPPPPAPSNEQQSIPNWAIALLIMGAFLVGAVIFGVNRGPAPEVVEPEPVAEEVAESTPSTPEPEPEPAPEPEVAAPTPDVEVSPPDVEPPPPPALPSHDWPSVADYELDMLDSIESVDVILDLSAGALDIYALMYPYGDPVDMIATLTQARSSLGTHIDYFTGTTPPAEYAEFQRYALEAWDLLDQSFVATIEGVRHDDLVAMDRAGRLTDQAIAAYDRAFAAMP